MRVRQVEGETAWVCSFNARFTDSKIPASWILPFHSCFEANKLNKSVWNAPILGT